MTVAYGTRELQMGFKIRVPEPALKELKRGRIVGRQRLPALPFEVLVIEDDNEVIEYIDASGRRRKFCLLNGRVMSCA